ncbi:hypothetical protein N7451_012359 [Penicillium sp. IBT 35674x]|nr:hypothetical protein N7451_012359 [Penicillium sp. IBT 35674x]
MVREQTERISPERAKHLERNRIAANKCRLKKKREHQQIQSNLHREATRRDSLMADLNILRNDIWVLKNAVFEHASCNDQRINRQLATMSENLIGASPELLRSPFPTHSTEGCSDVSAVRNKSSPVVSSEVSGSQELVADPALYDEVFTEITDLSLDRFINIECL